MSARTKAFATIAAGAALALTALSQVVLPKEYKPSELAASAVAAQTGKDDTANRRPGQNAGKGKGGKLLPDVTSAKPIPTGLVDRATFKNSEGRGENSPVQFFSDCADPIAGMAGGYCQIAWSDLEPEPGKYDFSMIDDSIAKAAKINTNKKGVASYQVMIRVRTGIWSPDWIKEKANSVDWFFKGTFDPHVLPAFWSHYYSTRYEKLNIALAERYDTNPYVGMVASAMCMTVSDETMWNRLGRASVEDTNLETLLDAGYTAGKDVGCLKRQTEIHARQWKLTPTYFAAHPFIRHSAKAKNVKDYETAEEIFQHCREELGARCILGNNSIEPNESHADKIYANIKAHADAGFPAAYQTHVFADGVEVGKAVFDMDGLLETIPVAAEWGGVFVELPDGWWCKDLVTGERCGSKPLRDERLADMLEAAKPLNDNAAKL